MDQPTRDPPFPDACRTGHKFISPCCTASQTEYLVDGVLHLASRIAGHGWFPARPGRIKDINDDGWVVEADGRERRIRWQPDREGG